MNTSFSRVVWLMMLVGQVPGAALAQEPAAKKEEAKEAEKAAAPVAAEKKDEAKTDEAKKDEVKKADDAKPAEKKPEPAKDKINAGLFGAVSARGIGPALMSGRISDLAVNPTKPSEFFVAVASGGVWKTTNAGVNFSPIFDGQGSYSIGCVTLDPQNPATVWVGTGENNSQRSVGFGDGVYVSRDGGKSFSKKGLESSEHIGMIAVHPGDSNTVFVAAQGPLWNSGGERGLYKTTDGGATWTRVLHISDDTGVSEVHIDPRNPDVMLAVAYQRRRHVWTLINGGPESSVYKSTDGGANWRKVESGLPGGDKGRIGLAISPANSDVVYAIVEAAEGAGGIFRSTDRGETWNKRSGYVATSPQYYQELICDPKNVDRFYSMDTFLHVTEDGGVTMRPAGEADKHVDNHAMWIDPQNTDHLLVGCDGGLYETFDRCKTWRMFENLSITQFYRVALDNSEPFYYVYGGTQDNSTLGGPSRTTDRAGISNEDWFITTGGDGFETVVDPTDPNTVYSESQDGGLVRFDRKTGEEVDIKPQEKEGDAPFVFNWDTPLLISPHNPQRLYFAGNFLFRSDDRGDTWTRISGDLTRGIDRNALKVMGKVQKPEAVAKHQSTSIFGNAVALSESPKVEGLIYVGTDDGMLHVTEDGGKTWRKSESVAVTGMTIPDMTYVSGLCASRHNADTVYACFDNHKMGDYTPYLLRSDDRGRTWRSIAGDLGKKETVYCIVEDHEKADLLFCGTEFGCFFTLDGGTKWMKVSGVPPVAIRDLEIQRRENDLVMASFGRGFFVVDDYSPLRQVTAELLEKPGVILPVKKALSYVPRSRLGGGSGRGWSGSSYFAAPNPPMGAVFTYHVKEKTKTLREQRKEAEKKDDWKYPTIEQFRAEDAEEEPRMVLTIRDKGGAVVRQIPASRDAGLHRAAWNLRYPDLSPVAASAGERAPWDVDTGGPLAPPGMYSVQLARISGGKTETLSDPVMFEVAELTSPTLAAKGAARDEKFAFEMKAFNLQRAVQGASRSLGEAEARISSLTKAAAETPGFATAEALDQLEQLRLKARAIRMALSGDSTRARRVMATSPSISERTGNAAGAANGSTQKPTTTQREQYELAAAEFEKVLVDLRSLIETDLKGVEAKLEAAGAPWTPGRLPQWKRDGAAGAAGAGGEGK